MIFLWKDSNVILDCKALVSLQCQTFLSSHVAFSILASFQTPDIRTPFYHKNITEKAILMSARQRKAYPKSRACYSSFKNSQHSS